MRVIAGTARSLKLETPKGSDTRPTTDRIKETLFNMLQFDLQGARFLDLFAGSGGIGIEAISRGAAEAVFVDNDKESQRSIMQNLEHTRFENRARLMKQDVFVALQMLEYQGSFDIIFMDPPYGKELERKVLEYLTMSSLVTEDTLIVFEASLETATDYIEELGYTLLKEKCYKTNKHVFCQRKHSPDSLEGKES